MARRSESDHPLSGAEREARRRAKQLILKPAYKPALASLAARQGKTPEQLADEVLGSWLASCKLPAPPPVSVEELAGADTLDAHRRGILAHMAEIINRADAQQLNRLAARIDVFDAIIPPRLG